MRELLLGAIAAVLCGSVSAQSAEATQYSVRSKYLEVCQSTGYFLVMEREVTARTSPHQAEEFAECLEAASSELANAYRHLSARVQSPAAKTALGEHYLAVRKTLDQLDPAPGESAQQYGERYRHLETKNTELWVRFWKLDRSSTPAAVTRSNSRN